MKLSIVVPVYNVERYVRKCILSIINQDDEIFKSLELIIINDGTKDKSVEQIQDLADKFENIKLVNQENLGLSMARNNGMKIAKGDYVWFVDSDDWISRNAVKTIMPYLDNVNDIITINYITVTEKGEFPNSTPFNEVKTLSGKESFRKKCEFGTMAQRGIYRKEFMSKNNLSFMPGVYNQDDELCVRASYLAGRVTLLPQPVYYFLRTTGEKHKSIMNTVNPKYGFDYLAVSKSLYDFSKKYVAERDLKQRFAFHIAVLINNGLNSISKCSEKDQQRFCELYNEQGCFNKCLHLAGGKYAIEALLFSIIHTSQMVKIYNQLKKFK